MSTNQRVYHQTRGFHLKLNQAIKAVENGAAVWIEYGKMIRSATIAESITARNEQAKLAERLESAEIRGIVFKAPGGEQVIQDEIYKSGWARRFAAAVNDKKADEIMRLLSELGEKAMA